MRVLGLALLGVAPGCIHFPATPDVAARPSGADQPVLIHDVRVFTGDAVLEHTDVRFARGTITDVRPTGAPSPSDAVVEGAGRTLLPGLIDLHVHLSLGATPPWFLVLPSPEHAAQSMVYGGVTTVLDMAGDPKVMNALDADIARGRWLGPRIVFAGAGLSVPGAYPLDLTRDVYGELAYASVNGKAFIAAETLDELLAGVDANADAGATFVKLFVATIPPGLDPPTPRLPEAWVKAAVDHAHARGLRVAAHIDTAEDALICARSGVDLLAHGVETSAVSDADLALLVASGIQFEPTLVNWNRFDELLSASFTPTQAERATQPKRALDSFSADQLQAHAALLEGSSFRSWSDALTAHKADRVANTKAMFDAGVPLRVGSDSGGSIGTFPGALHEELRLLVEAGVPTLAVLEAATKGNATFLDPDARYGQVAPGYEADLLLVDGDPTVDIGRTEDIVQVYVRGQPVRPLVSSGRR